MVQKIWYRAVLLFLLGLFGIGLASEAFGSSEEWKRYDNGRFGYHGDYPLLFANAAESQNGDGIWMVSPGGEYRLTFSGGYNVLGKDGREFLEERLQDVLNPLPGAHESGSHFYRLSYHGGEAPGELCHEYGLVDENTWASFILVYPGEEKDRFKAIIERMESTLKLPAPSFVTKYIQRRAPFRGRSSCIYRIVKVLEIYSS